MTDLQARLTHALATHQSLAGNVIVFGEGNTNHPRLAFVGEAPGADEVKQGRPFVGAAGRNLDVMLATLGQVREQIYITNLVKVRPTRINPRTGRTNNRPPTPAEVAFFRPYLLEELAELSPNITPAHNNRSSDRAGVTPLGGDASKSRSPTVRGRGTIVVTLGNFALTALAPGHGTIGELHGQLIQANHKLFALYHPAAAIYNRALGTTIERDLLKLRTILEEGFNE